MVGLFSSSAFSEGAKSEHGGGGGEGGAEAQALPKDQREFEEKTSKLNYMTSLIEESSKEFEHLVHEKEEAKTAEEKQAVIKEMVELIDRRNKNIETYNKVRMELTLRYPNKGEHLNRHYQPKSQKTLEELESSGGLDDLLTATKKQVEKKYAPFAPNDQNDESHSQKAHLNSHGGKHPRLRLEK